MSAADEVRARIAKEATEIGHPVLVRASPRRRRGTRVASSLVPSFRSEPQPPRSRALTPSPRLRLRAGPPHRARDDRQPDAEAADPHPDRRHAAVRVHARLDRASRPSRLVPSVSLSLSLSLFSRASLRRRAQLENFARKGDQINLIHVIPKRYTVPAYYAFDEFVPEVPDPEQEAEWREDANRYVRKRLYTVLDANEDVTYTSEVVAYETSNESVGEIICERANDVDACAVIMASHGKGRFREFFIGSVTNYCLHRCKKPVIVYRSPPAKDAERTNEHRTEEAEALLAAEEDEAKMKKEKEEEEKKAKRAEEDAKKEGHNA